MMGRKATQVLLCCAGLYSLTGCAIVIPTVPLNAPGYAHTYQVLDQHDRPIKEGFLILQSHYFANEEMFRVYPIKDGRAEVPLKFGTRCSGMALMPFPIWIFYCENPYGTYVYPVAPGYVYNDGWDISSRDDPDFMYGIAPPPNILRMSEAVPDLELESLDYLSHPAQITHQAKDDQAARVALKEYIEKRLAQLPPSKIEFLEAAIWKDKDIKEVRRLLDMGADPNFQHLKNLDRPIFMSLGDVEILRLLIERGTQVNVLDRQDCSPFYYADSEEVRTLLLEHGADPRLGKQREEKPDRPLLVPTSSPDSPGDPSESRPSP